MYVSALMHKFSQSEHIRSLSLPYRILNYPCEVRQEKARQTKRPPQRLAQSAARSSPV